MQDRINKLNHAVQTTGRGDIENAPTFGTQLNTDDILGMAKIEGGVKILPVIDDVLTASEIGLQEKAVQERAMGNRLWVRKRPYRG